MVRTAVSQQTGQNLALNLGIGVPELRDGIQAVAPEEMSAAAQRATITAGKSPVGGRLLTLVSRRMSVAEVTRDADGQLALVERAVARGGGAAADPASRWGGFVNLNYNGGEFDGTELQPAFDFDTFGVTAGVDYRFSDNFTAGLALTFDNNDADYKFALGNVESKGFSVTLYGAYTRGPWYVDSHLSYSSIDFDTRRNIVIPSVTATPGINASATGSPDGSQWGVTIGAGYDFRIDNVNVTPYGRLGYLRLEVDGFTENEPNEGLGLDVNSQKLSSLQSALGVRVSTPVSTTYGVVTPYAMIEWNHEFKNDSRSLVAAYTFDPFRTFFVIPTDSPDRNFFTLSLGASAQFARGISGFLNVDGFLGQSGVTNVGVTLGGRMEF
jgi:outer membrane lipase/esterase